jgi:hypothetical protein
LEILTKDHYPPTSAKTNSPLINAGTHIHSSSPSPFFSPAATPVYHTRRSPIGDRGDIFNSNYLAPGHYPQYSLAILPIPSITFCQVFLFTTWAPHKKDSLLLIQLTHKSSWPAQLFAASMPPLESACSSSRLCFYPLSSYCWLSSSFSS